MIKVAAFDIGKVLLDFDYGIFVRRMAPRTRMDVPTLDAFLNQSPLLAQYESGQLTSPEFFTVVQNETGFDGTEPEFAAYFEDIFTPIDEIIAMHAKLVASGLPTYTFSNTNEMAVRHIIRAYDFWPRFTGHILSHEVRALKPNPKIYEVFEQTTGCQGNEILYLDDRPENVAAAATRGWHAIEHRDAEFTREAVMRLGVLC
ncbi:MAG TPA: HAD family phosphatase [Verrucomicrobiales bacterium]|nr:HAD family phosphatase [Verrucomicrobiales bacterium]